MENSQRYPFVAADMDFGEAGFRPYLPLILSYKGKSSDVTGLLDSGAMVNVLPHSVGVELGATWNEQTTHLQLTGNLAQVEARVLLLSARVGTFPSVRLAFAWTKTDNVPLLLGQINFFREYNFCFYRSELASEISQKR
ncbi:MAG: hypothetical protein KJZ86_08200 [Caldilineaceae bacterium]|nr:hypothetical protein [Caldilineaceae bacterium]HRJ44502.1 hypothetical protein [Caldilineaceae bacterium]